MFSCCTLCTLYAPLALFPLLAHPPAQARLASCLATQTILQSISHNVPLPLNGFIKHISQTCVTRHTSFNTAVPDLGSLITGLPSLAGVRLTGALLGRSGPQQLPVDVPWTAPQPETKLPGQHRRRPKLSSGAPCQAVVLVSTCAHLMLPKNTVLAAGQSICWSPHICSPVHTGPVSLVHLTGPFCIQHKAAHACNLHATEI